MATRAETKERRPITAAQLLHDLERRAPELFAPDYDTEAIADALIENGLPAPALRDVVRSFVQWHRGDFQARRPTTAAERMAERVEAGKRATDTKRRVIEKGLVEVGPDFVMSDGRRLGAWLVSELEKLGGVFAFIVAKAGADKSRTVDQVMSARDWKKANAP